MRRIDADLHEACELGDSDRVRDLLKRGADPNSLHTNGYSPLMHAVRAWRASSTKRIQTTRVLLEHDANASYIAPDGYQAVQLAHDLEVVRFLIEAGVSVDRTLATDLTYEFSGSRGIRDLLSQCAGATDTDWTDSPRQVYQRVLGYPGNDLAREVLAEATPFLRSVIADLGHCATYDPTNETEVATDASIAFYAISRLNEILLLRFQRHNELKEPQVWFDLSMEQYTSFWQDVGMDVVIRSQFHPFFHQIAEVENSVDPAQDPLIMDTRWPCLMFGELLFSRGGVSIQAGADSIDKSVAEQSTLYWSHRRVDRPCSDQSHGWGHNSQWATDFRRDYWSGDRLCYNVGASTERQRWDSELTEEQRGELLRHRCFVRHEEVMDCYPYHFSAWDKYENKTIRAR